MIILSMYTTSVKQSKKKRRAWISINEI